MLTTRFRPPSSDKAIRWPPVSTTLIKWRPKVVTNSWYFTKDDTFIHYASRPVLKQWICILHATSCYLIQ